MDEISAEDEIREAFKVFDSVSWEQGRAKHIRSAAFSELRFWFCELRKGSKHNRLPFLKLLSFQKMNSQLGKRVQNTTITEKLPFLKIPFVSEWRRLHQPPRAGLCHGQLGIADGQGWNWGRLWIDHIWSSCFTFHNFGFTKMEKGEIKVEP